MPGPTNTVLISGNPPAISVGMDPWRVVSNTSVVLRWQIDPNSLPGYAFTANGIDILPGNNPAEFTNPQLLGNGMFQVVDAHGVLHVSFKYTVNVVKGTGTPLSLDPEIVNENPMPV